MLEVPVYNTSGQQIETLKIDESHFGAKVNVALVKQAVVAYHANRRQGTVATKSRGMVEGSTKKLFAQKHTGNARRGPIRTNVMRGGGRAFGKVPHSYRQGLPRTMRRRALESAILAKILGQDLLVVDGLKVETPKTKFMADVLDKLKINRSCLLTIAGHNETLWKSARNIPDLAVCTTANLNAFDVATRQKLLVTREAMSLFIEAGLTMKNDIYNVIVRPLVTEKGTHQSTALNAYAFQVNLAANKNQIKQAIEKIYNVKVVEVRTAKRKGKPRRAGYKMGTTAHWKKAVVVLHPDYHIDLF